MTIELAELMAGIGAAARAAANSIREARPDVKERALLDVVRRIESNTGQILAANREDIEAATDLSPAMIDRMTLNPTRLAAIVQAIELVARKEDPVGKVIAEWRRPSGLEFSRVRTPIGVIAVIYESRPNVTVDAAAIAIKAGNAVILRGGSDCIRTNTVLARLFREGLREGGLPEDALQFVDTTDRDAVGSILSGLNGAIDLVIPRGGRSLVSRVQSDARVAVLGHLEGICHVYLDKAADIEKAVEISVNSKMRRTGVCGAAETLLVDRVALSRLLPAVAAALRQSGCEMRGDDAVRQVEPGVNRAIETDWHTEYLAPILSIAAVDGVDGAVAHIARYGSGHTDAIVTEDADAASRFLERVDSAIVLHNASTQFADGGEFGFGAEIGIATGRLHARGPVGVEELTTYKTIVRGVGQVRSR